MKRYIIFPLIFAASAAYYAVFARPPGAAAGAEPRFAPLSTPTMSVDKIGTPTPDWEATRGIVAIENERAMGELERQIIVGRATGDAIATMIAERRISDALTETAAAASLETSRADSATATFVAPTIVKLASLAEAEAKYGGFVLVADAIGQILAGAGMLALAAALWWVVRLRPEPKPAAAAPGRIIRINPPNDDGDNSGAADFQPSAKQTAAVADYLAKNPGKRNLTFLAFVRQNDGDEMPFSRAEFEQFRAWLIDKSLAYMAGEERLMVVLTNDGLAFFGGGQK